MPERTAAGILCKILVPSRLRRVIYPTDENARPMSHALFSSSPMRQAPNVWRDEVCHDLGLAQQRALLWTFRAIGENGEKEPD
jgi:hypothetical protein